MKFDEMAECTGCGDWYFRHELHANDRCDSCERGTRAALRAAEVRSRIMRPRVPDGPPDAA